MNFHQGIKSRVMYSDGVELRAQRTKRSLNLEAVKSAYRHSLSLTK